MPISQDRAVPSEDELAALYALDSIKGFGPQKVKETYLAGVSPSEIIENPDLLPISGKRGATFRQALHALRNRGIDEFAERARRQLDRAAEFNAHLLTYAHPSYPRNVFDSNNPIPILYVRGSLEVLSAPAAVACVGSRKTEGAYAIAHDLVARAAVNWGLTVVSGFALGADTIGHVTAFENGGRTVCVMPCGVDLPFPPENRELWKKLLEYPGATFVSEFALATKAASLTLRKRNKLIVAFARGVFVSQTSATGGAMNAYRFALEQKKPVAALEPDGSPETSGNAAIAHDESGRTTVFPAAQVEEAADAWLMQLSSST